MHGFMGRKQPATVIQQQQTILLEGVNSHLAIAYRLPCIQPLMMVLHLGTSCLGCNMSIPPTCNMHIIRAARSQTTHLACHHLPASIHHLPLSVSAPHDLAQHHHPSALHLRNHSSENIPHVLGQKSVRQCLESALWQVCTDVLCNSIAHAKAGMYKSQARLNDAIMAWMSSMVGMTKC